MNRVMLLGCGFSKAVGKAAGVPMPLTKDLIDLIKKTVSKKPIPNLRKVIPQLRRFKRSIDIEEVYDLIDRSAKLKEHLWAGKNPHEPDPLLKEIRFAISSCLLEIHRFNYHALAKAAANMIKRVEPSAIITLNWDLITDVAVENSSSNIIEGDAAADMYGFMPDARLSVDTKDNTLQYDALADPIFDSFKLLKLHGSLSWFACRDSSHVTIINPKDAALVYKSDDFRCPQDQSKLDPLILPPSSAKDYSVHPFPTIWRRALVELSNADEIIVYGCGIREADFYLKDLLFKARMRKEPKVKIEDPDYDGVKGRLADLVGYRDMSRWRDK